MSRETWSQVYCLCLCLLKTASKVQVPGLPMPDIPEHEKKMDFLNGMNTAKISGPSSNGAFYGMRAVSLQPTALPPPKMLYSPLQRNLLGNQHFLFHWITQLFCRASHRLHYNYPNEWTGFNTAIWMNGPAQVMQGLPRTTADLAPRGRRRRPHSLVKYS